MLRILNTKVYDLTESVIASGNAMRLGPALCTNEEFEKGIERMKKLRHASQNSDVHCHDNALTGIRVSFDIYYPQYWSMEFQRYHFADIVTSSSKMHRLCKMDFDKACNRYVDPRLIYILEEKVRNYNNAVQEQAVKSIVEECFMEMISNVPMGLELFMRVSTNYKQLQTIYFQRRNHRLPEWRVFCNWIESLPYAKELIIGEENEG